MVSRVSFALFLFLTALFAETALSDTFGTGVNQFTLDFVAISGTTNPTSGYGIVNYSYRMGTYEITNDQWNKFAASQGVPVLGNPITSYDENFRDYGTGTTKVPTNNVSWFEAAQFVNWVNTSTGHQAAYKFTGTPGTSNYTFVNWSPSNPGYDANNPYRNSNAYYFLPSENEWIKAAYWNGTSLQQYATKPDDSLIQGDGTSGTGWNYYENGYATDPSGPWNVGRGSQELNGTYDMMGNVVEWTESPRDDIFGDYNPNLSRGLFGGSWYSTYDILQSPSRNTAAGPSFEIANAGFRVASVVPEPSSLALLLAAGLCSAAFLAKRRW